MGMFWEFFTFELRFRFKSISTYVYFLLWVAFSFLCIASESFGPVANANGKVLLNGPWAISLNYRLLQPVWSADHRRHLRHLHPARLSARHLPDTVHQADFQVRLPGRPLGRLVRDHRADLQRPDVRYLSRHLGARGPIKRASDRITCGGICSLSCPSCVMQIFFCGSLFFAVAALTRKIFIVYLQGVALFMAYLIGITVFSATRSLEHFWSGILDPVGLLLNNAVTRYWSVDREEHAACPLGFLRLFARRIPLQPIAVDRRRTRGAGVGMGSVSHVGRGADGTLARATRGASAPAG